MAVVERNLHAEAEERLGRELSAGEKLIDLAGNDRILEEAKEDLYSAIEKEKRRAIRAFLAGKTYDMRVTGEMREILKRLRRAGQKAAELELEKAPEMVGAFSADLEREMALWHPLVRWEMRPVDGGAGGYDIFDKDVERVIQHFGPHEFERAQGFIDGMVRKAMDSLVDTGSEAVSPSPQEVRSAIERGVAPQIPQLRGNEIVGNVGPGAQPFIPHDSVVIAERARLIAEGVLKAAPPMPAGQMLLFDPQMQPLMDAMNMHMRGITRRITKEGNAALEIHQDAGVQALARAIDKKVPGALDAAGRMVSGPFNAGLGDVFKRKGGLFTKWQYSAVMDKRTCHVCAYFDGTIYMSWRSIADVPGAPLPGGGPNPGCFGENRCRCRPVPYFGEGHVGDVEPTGVIPTTSTRAGTGYDGPGGWPPDIERKMATEPIESIQSLGGGVSSTYQGWLPDGTHVKIVPYNGTRQIYDQIPLHSDGKNEQANWILARDFFNPAGPNKVNIPPHVAREVAGHGMSDVSAMVDGFEGGGEPNSEDIPGWSLFDAIVGQHDHHRNNASWDDKGGFWLIDNGLSFPERAPRYFAGHTRPWSEYGYKPLSLTMRNQLDALERQHAQIEEALKPYLNEGQRKQMWRRISKMLETDHLVTPDLVPYG